MEAEATSAGAKAQARWEERASRANSWFCDVAPIKRVADRCGMQPWAVAVAGASWFVGFLLWGFTGELICTAAGSLYPMYASFKALEDGDQEEVHVWLMYWVTYAALVLTEALLYRMLCWIPFYHIMRLLLVFWLFLPITRGARGAYTWFVSPLLRRYRPSIDGALAMSAEELHGTLAGTRNKEFRKALRSAVAAATTPCRSKCDEGASEKMVGSSIQDWMAQELAKEAASRLGRVAAASAAGMLDGAAAPAPPQLQQSKGASTGNSSVGARTRTASPRPACLAPVQADGSEDSKFD
mmetsp:Transcript_36255/g.91269  ORF Transcript_36255/g.91269 Transcript_36255/m.91269 type:complete len:297 (-) Transcript_36255:184-1074(-)|eukprot:CAMPEP_0115244758 /NCGR_PEP_ID=MMETSP0270-20121206/40150_1 /TAXON_ID=71861 /ORGANISM="Scrippsiella trochoidea, Strain CCMP3099" /LENGTH=296 /DNA_ID=CAMNT_0002659899 /DNA_START=56 /DNA_END=946 /DNA_ORIENTATION=+